MKKSIQEIASELIVLIRKEVTPEPFMNSWLMVKPEYIDSIIAIIELGNNDGKYIRMPHSLWEDAYTKTAHGDCKIHTSSEPHGMWMYGANEIYISIENADSLLELLRLNTHIGLYRSLKGLSAIDFRTFSYKDIYVKGDGEAPSYNQILSKCNFAYLNLITAVICYGDRVTVDGQENIVYRPSEMRSMSFQTKFGVYEDEDFTGLIKEHDSYGLMSLVDGRLVLPLAHCNPILSILQGEVGQYVNEYRLKAGLQSFDYKMFDLA